MPYVPFEGGVSIPFVASVGLRRPVARHSSEPSKFILPGLRELGDDNVTPANGGEGRGESRRERESDGKRSTVAADEGGCNRKESLPKREERREKREERREKREERREKREAHKS